MNKLVFLIVAFLVVPSFAGCLEPEDKRTIVKETTPFDFETPLPITTYYHFDGALNASEYYEMNGTSVLYGNNVPIFSHGTYYGIGTTSFYLLKLTNRLAIKDWEEYMRRVTSIV